MSTSIPAEPDTERRTHYTATAQTGPFPVGFDLYGDGSDYQNWIEVFVNGVKLTQSGNWTLSSASGTIANLARPITDATITFTAAQTGTIDIVGARRPRRMSQFNENRPITAHDQNQVLTDLWMTMRERWDRIPRTILAPPGETIGPLPPASTRANMGMTFDINGNPSVGALPSSGFISSAMQPVVGAATLAAGRALFGFGTMAGENIGAGLQDDGTTPVGTVRVNFATVADSTNQSVVAAFHMTQRNATGALTYTLPRANTLWNGFGFWIYARTGIVTLAINAADNIQGQANGASVGIPAGSVAFITTDAATAGTWLVQWSPVALPLAVPTVGSSFSGLKIINNGAAPDTKIDVSAVEITVVNSAGYGLRIASPLHTINAATAGVVNGLDTGSLAASSWYYVYEIAGISLTGAQQSGALLSLSSTAPTLPTGYQYSKRVGAVRTDASVHFLRTVQLGKRVQYVTGSFPTVTTSAPGIASYSSVSISGFVPTTASVFFFIVDQGSGSGTTYVNANTSPGPSAGGYIVKIATPAGVSGGANGSLIIESSNIGWASTGTPILSAQGWEDNI